MLKLILKRMALILAVGATIICGTIKAQSTAPAPSGKDRSLGWLWIERFDGSSDADGRIYSITSSTGYNFNHHFGIDLGIPVYIVNAAATSTTPATTTTGIGNAFVAVRFAVDSRVLNFRSSVSGSAPTGSSKKGLSTGHATFDWTNRFERGVSRFTPFGEIGVGNSLPERMLFLRPFTSYGYLSHVEGGADIDIIGPLSMTASAYDILPWGTQTVFSRVSGHGNGSHGRSFETSQKTSGGASLTRDYGFNLNADISVGGRFDLYAGYTRSMTYALNSVSFGVGINLKTLLHGKGK
jgi:hypothetical protein